MSSKENIKFERISIKEGLSQVVVTCILQDSQGFMWFGTQDGLNRYDGYNFLIFRKDASDKNSLSNNHITCLHEDSEGFIWIGTSGGGLNRFDRKKNIFKCFVYSEDNPDSISFNQIRCVREDTSGDIWVGTSTGGLNKFIKSENKFIRYCSTREDPESINSNSIRCIYEDSKKNLWFGTWGEGLKKYNSRTGGFLDYKNYNSDIPNANRINSIFEDNEGIIWLATNLGLHKLNPETKSYTEYIKSADSASGISDNLVSVIFEYEPGILWIGTREGGLNIFDIREEKFISFLNSDTDEKSLSNNSIMDIAECKSGLIWIATHGGGLNKFSRKQKNIKHYYHTPGINNCLSSNKILALCEDSTGNIWIGTNDSGLNKFDRLNNVFEVFPKDKRAGCSLSDYKISFVKEDKNKNLLVSTELGGLNIVNLNNGEVRVFKHDKENPYSLSHNYATHVIEDENNILWAGTFGGGLNKIYLKENKILHFKHNPEDHSSIGSNKIRVFYKSADGTFWIGLDSGGINRFNPETGKFKRYEHDLKDESSISGNDVLTLYEDSKRRLWIGTSGEGLNYFDRENDQFIRFGMSDGLPNDTVYGILEDDSGNLWISTNKGISRFNPEERTFRNFDEKDGLQSNEFNQGAYLKLKSGELAFGGVNGLNIFSPGNMKDNDYKPSVVITDFQIFNKKVNISENGSPLKEVINVTNELFLTYRESVFSFEFASLDYNIPEKNQYAYMMTGFDKNWNYSGSRRFATYTNLNPGEYIFKVKGSNNDGCWNEEGVSVKINISPPFWKTIWFKGLSILTVAGIAGGVYREKLNKVRKEKEAQIVFTKKLIETQEADRKRIAAELHDSLGHELLITKNKLLLTVKNPDDKEFIANEVNDATEILSNAIQDVREISYSLHPYQIERLGLTKAIESIADRVAKSTKIKFFKNLDLIDKVLLPEQEINLYRIIQECINNIVKHSGAEEVLLNLNKDEKYISVVISDDGKGFNMSEVADNSDKHGFGLKGMKERAKLFNGSFEIHSEAGNGTEVKISIPFVSEMS